MQLSIRPFQQAAPVRFGGNNQNRLAGIQRNLEKLLREDAEFDNFRVYPVDDEATRQVFGGPCLIATHNSQNPSIEWDRGGVTPGVQEYQALHAAFERLAEQGKLERIDPSAYKLQGTVILVPPPVTYL